jgi:hypothetical protein
MRRHRPAPNPYIPPVTPEESEAALLLRKNPEVVSEGLREGLRTSEGAVGVVRLIAERGTPPASLTAALRHPNIHLYA